MSLKQKTLFGHLLFWFLIVIPVILVSNIGWDQLLDVIVVAIMLYGNYFILIPLLIKKPKPSALLTWFFSAILFSFILNTSASYLISAFIPEMSFRTSFFIIALNAMIPGMFAIVLSISARLYYSWFKNNEINKSLVLKKTESELQTMKNDIDIPNMIELLQALEERAIDNPNAVQDDIVYLSDILRYNLYESSEKIVRLEKELNVTQEFLSLYSNISNQSYSITNHCTETEHIKTSLLLKIVEILVKLSKEALALEITEHNQHCYLKIVCSKAINQTLLEDRISTLFPFPLDIMKEKELIYIQLN